MSAREPRLFLPPTPGVEEPYRLSPRMAIRIAILGVVAIALFCTLFFRLWALQILSSERYSDAALNNQIRTFRIQAPRGTILDRNGEVLVSNIGGTVVQLWPATLAELPSARRQTMIQRLTELLNLEPGDIEARLEASRNDPLRPVTIKRAVRKPKVNYLLEHQAEFPGVQVAQTQLRRHERDSLAAHIFGYVSEITAEQLAEKEDDDYVAGDIVGQTGIERTYDAFLRGVPGEGQVPVNASGRVTGERRFSRLPEAGNAVRLTLDAGLQATAEDALRFGIELARETYERGWASNGGAIVALDPNNGEILALASYPTFDPRIWVGQRDPKKLARLEDPQNNFPALNRAVAGLYPAGSTFKPVTALAALHAGEVTGGEFIQCTAEREIDGQVFKNWNPYVNEAMEMRTAIAASCDTYFYELALRFFEREDSPLQEWAGRMGFGHVTGIDIGPEGEGLVPTPAWRRQHFDSAVDKLWKSGDSVNLAIGQGDLLVTPLQMTLFYAMVANGGNIVEPHLVLDVQEARTKDAPPLVLRSFTPKAPEPVGLDPAALNIVQEGLLDATHASYGTSASVFADYDIPIAGKTGTAEKFVSLQGFEGLLDQSWWCGYGPVDRPELAVCALIENGGKGSVAAAPAALKVFEHHFGIEADYAIIAEETD